MTELSRVTELAELLVKTKDELAAAEAIVAQKKTDMLRLERDDLPMLMQEVGLKEIRLTSGKTISIKEDCDAKISEANKPRAFAWLVERGFGGIIKTAVTLAFGKGEHEEALKAREALAKKYPSVALEEGVHPQTLKAFVKERMEKGEPVPADLFGVFAYSKAVVKD